MIDDLTREELAAKIAEGKVEIAKLTAKAEVLTEQKLREAEQAIRSDPLFQHAARWKAWKDFDPTLRPPSLLGNKLVGLPEGLPAGVDFETVFEGIVAEQLEGLRAAYASAAPATTAKPAERAGGLAADFRAGL